MEEVYRHPPFDPRRLKPTELDPVIGPIDRALVRTFELKPQKVGMSSGEDLATSRANPLNRGRIPASSRLSAPDGFSSPPLHRRLRRMVDGVAIVMLLTLLYLALAPGFDALNIPTFGTNSVRLGLLDYPLLGLIVVPLILTPLILRLTVNVGDLRRQTNIMADEQLRLEVDVEHVDSEGTTRIKIDGLASEHAVFASLQCGVLAPRRHHILNALSRNPRGQPPPGMTTAWKAWNPRWGTVRGSEKNRRCVVTTGRVTSTFDR